MISRRTGLKLLLAAGALPLAACGGDDGARTSVFAPRGTVLDAAEAGGARRFVAALDEAGLTATLSGAGPYTLFAPTDRAFAAADVPSDPAALAKLLSYHVVPGDFTSDFLSGVDINYTTLAGTSLNVDGKGALTVNGANVVALDLKAGNGVVHTIDRVLQPR